MPKHSISKAVQTDTDDGTRVAQKRFNPLEMLELRKVVKARGSSINLRGRVFLLRYEGSSFFYRPEEGFVPCGWLNIKHVENYVQSLEP